MFVNYPLPRITAIQTTTPDHDIHQAFIQWARAQLQDRRDQILFDRMAARSGIKHRYAVLPPGPDGGSPVDRGGFYAAHPLPGTAARMLLYGHHAPLLALKAIAGLAFDPGTITHIIVASCTGFVAPGVDQIIADRVGLSPSIERLLIGFMGCYAAVSALRSARHIVRSDPDANVLVVTVELSSLHLQPVQAIEPLLAMLQFGDGAAAAIVSANGLGVALESPFAIALPGSADLIRWDIGDQGFAMHLSGDVPLRIADALANPATRDVICGDPAGVSHWAVHAGGRSILDAVGNALDLPEDRLATSRAVLRDFGNMSSATLMFALAAAMSEKPRNGVALAFGPGLAAEGFRFRWVT